jgi:tetratricopeptide (TPR) repeat protein
MRTRKVCAAGLGGLLLLVGCERGACSHASAQGARVGGRSSPESSRAQSDERSGRRSVRREGKIGARASTQAPIAVAPASPRGQERPGFRKDPADARPRFRSGSVDALVAAGFRSLVQFQHRAATAAFMLALESAPNHGEAHYGLGLLLVQAGRWPRAVQAFAEAATHAPALIEAHVELGVVLHVLGRAEESTLAYDNALELNPEYERARFNRALARRALGAIRGARSDFEELLESERFGVASQVELALLRLRAGGARASAGATRYLRAALRRDPRCSGAHYNLGQLLIQLGHVPEGRGHLRRVVDEPYAALAQAALRQNAEGQK